jgi:hypothetical protein
MTTPADDTIRITIKAYDYSVRPELDEDAIFDEKFSRYEKHPFVIWAYDISPALFKDMFEGNPPRYPLDSFNGEPRLNLGMSMQIAERNLIAVLNHSLEAHRHSRVTYDRYSRIEGCMMRWHQNGKPQSEIPYKGGKRHGFHYIWDEAGNLIRDGEYCEDKPTGLWLDKTNKDGPSYFWYNEKGEITAEAKTQDKLLDLVTENALQEFSISFPEPDDFAL